MTSRNLTLAWAVSLLIGAVAAAVLIVATHSSRPPAPPPSSSTTNAAAPYAVDHTAPLRAARGMTIPRKSLVPMSHPAPATTASTSWKETATIASTTPAAAAKKLATGRDLDWAALRQCENRRQCQLGDCYRSDRGDRYRGAYQFDLGTWASVGGAGDPATAPPAEQDARAAELYRRAGRRPWPHCGGVL